MQPLLHIEGLSKTFGETRVLFDAHLEVHGGEIHGLLGQNGSGKSTLIKVLAGYHDADPGAQISVDGEPLAEPGQRRRLAFVHQDLGLVPELSILENLRVNRYHRRGAAPLSWKAERQLATDALLRFDLSWDLHMPVQRLNELDRALLAIVRAVSDIEHAATGGKGVLILDEPTVYLPMDGVERLFSAMRAVAEQGHGVLFVSHQLDEVLEITDRVSVLRDGHLVASADTKGLSETALVEMILGRSPEGLYPERDDQQTESPPQVQVAGLSGDIVRDLSFTAQRGEVVGLTGLAGAGYEEIPYLLFGSQRADTGMLTLGTRTQDLTTRRHDPGRSIQLGIALVPANRPRDGVVGALSVAENVGLPVIGRFRRHRHVQRGALQRHVADLVKEFDVRPPAPARKMASLSGGNQQKAVLAKWLQTEPVLLLLHEPTQGVDVGARGQIYMLIRRAAEGGMTVLIFSGEHEELGHICDRAIVFDRGSAVQELTGANLTPERLADAIYQNSSGLDVTSEANP